MSKIKAVVFDFVGVIEKGGHPNIVPVICEILSVPTEKWNEVYFAHNHLTNVGGLSWSECVLVVAEKLGADDKKLLEIKKIIEKGEISIFLNLELIEIIKKIKSFGYKIAVLSNYAFREDLNKKLENYKIRELFDVVVVSGDVGFQKPDPQIFEVLFKKLEVLPEEVVFVDDSDYSLYTAVNVGYIPILFKNNNQLKKNLIDILNIIFD